MKRAFSAVLLAALLGSSTGVWAQGLLDGSRVEDILNLALARGPATLESQANGAPRIAGSIDGVPYQLFFLNCTESCEDLNFYAGFRDIKPTMDAVNAWNRDKRFGNAYLDADLDAVIEFDVNVEYGVSPDNLGAAFALWTLLLGEFAEYVGYRP